MNLSSKVKTKTPFSFTQKLIITYILLFVVFCSIQLFKGRSLNSLFITQDQLGQIYYNSEKYEKAAATFIDPAWKGMAHYLNEDFTVAVDYFSQIDTDEALFNRANAWAHSLNYIYALNDYDVLLKKDPKNERVIKNRAIVQKIVDDINRLSESQQEETGDSGKMKKEDDPMMADGADKKTFEKIEIEQYTAEDLLNDPSISELWMKQVQANPAQFLSVKFQMQLQQQETPTKQTDKGGDQ